MLSGAGFEFLSSIAEGIVVFPGYLNQPLQFSISNYLCDYEGFANLFIRGTSLWIVNFYIQFFEWFIG